ncbi:MAG: inorganic phosphate transporter [Vampirovibrionales bacterium]|jgi:PiT family inorganic phosphate transporter|nr:inorganic phosphate transporter [Vampirovibrionales bacterium]
MEWLADPQFILLIVIISMALIFDYINGFHDAANAIATVVATRVMTPKTAVIFGAIFNLLGALMGTEVAATMGKGIVEAELINLETILCALIGAIVWNLITWWKGLPSSSSHALIGSLMGAACFWVGSFGENVVHWHKVIDKVIIPMYSSPLIGFTVGYMLMTLLTWMVYKISVNRINSVFGKLQIVSAGAMALSHGMNDAQKSMGIIALAIILYKGVPASEFHVGLEIVIPCAVAIGLGTLSGGWKIIRTLGSKMIKLQPIHGFAAEVTSFSVIMFASQWGIPLSTTHAITSTIMGVGATRRLSAVKWSLVGSILWAWVLTIPVTFLLSGGIALAYKWIQAQL